MSTPLVESVASVPRGVAVPFVVNLLNQYVAAGDVFVDVGCGPGLYRNVTSGWFIGVDCTAAPYHADWARDVDLVAEAAHLALRSGSIDLVMSKCAFYQFPDPVSALKDFFRVLKPGGRLLLIDYNRRTQRRLGRSENVTRPCWTQWQLKERAAKAGFSQLELLLPLIWQPPALLRIPMLFAQEVVGNMAIVTGIKPN